MYNLKNLALDLEVRVLSMVVCNTIVCHWPVGLES